MACTALVLTAGFAAPAAGAPPNDAATAEAAPPSDAATAEDEAGSESLEPLASDQSGPPPKAPDRPRRFSQGDPVEDPRVRELPRRHRFRLGLAASYIRLSAALNSNTGETTRFHHAPLGVDLAYQLQFAKRMMIRPGLVLAYNVANSRYAMPLTISPRFMFGYQGGLLGFAAGYAYLGVGHPLLTLENGADGRPDSVGGPIIYANHSVLGELSFTSRIDDVAIYFSLGAGATRTHLLHFDLDVKSWRFTMFFGAGFYFDGSRRRRKKAEAATLP